MINEESHAGGGLKQARKSFDRRRPAANELKLKEWMADAQAAEQQNRRSGNGCKVSGRRVDGGRVAGLTRKPLSAKTTAR